jgi:hypothetical protein
VSNPSDAREGLVYEVLLTVAGVADLGLSLRAESRGGRLRPRWSSKAR